MSYDIFQQLLTLRNTPATLATSLNAYNTTGGTYVNTFTAQTPWTWSNSLTNAALEWVNDKAPDGLTTKTDAYFQGRNKFFHTACKQKMFELTHSLSTYGTWNVLDVMADWFASTF